MKLAVWIIAASVAVIAVALVTAPRPYQPPVCYGQVSAECSGVYASIAAELAQ